MDNCDIANDYAQEALDRELSRLARKRKEELESSAKGRGLCSECDEPIPQARLKAVPTAKHCVFCAEILENSNRHRRT